MQHRVRGGLTGLIVVAVAALGLPQFIVAAAPLAGGQQSINREPLSKGRLIAGRDGDTVIIEGEERVRIIRRKPGFVRAVFNPAGRWIVLLVDYATQGGGSPDGRVDNTYDFRGVGDEWPLGERWEGEAIIEDYWLAQGPRMGTGIRTAQGFVQLLFGSLDNSMFQDPAAVALSVKGSGQGGAGGVSFADGERHAVAEVMRNVERNTQLPNGPATTTFTTTISTATGTLPGGIVVGPSQDRQDRGVAPARGGPIRVGGNIASPRKIHDVAAVLSESARQAGVRGVVILELTVGEDGAVTDARVLRSIPLLDDAAVQAARQWRYEPTLLNGQPVPVLLTATVNFP